MIYEIVTPYDAGCPVDWYPTLSGLFRKLMEMLEWEELEDYAQLEICVLRFESLVQREELMADQDYDSSKYVVLDLDKL
jgi:predicted Fe-S protein YdhL (DUF1289 family)